MRPLLAALGIILAGGIFFGYTKPAYDSIQTTQAQIAQYNAALDKATQLEELKQTLLARYNAFNPADLARLQVLLPDQVNNIGLILDLDTLANQYGMSLENVDINGGPNSTSDSSAAVGSVTAVGASSSLYDSLDVSFTIHGTYAQFIQYITSLETSLRIVDLVKLGVTGAAAATQSSGAQSSGVSAVPPVSTASVPGSDGIIYTFNVTLQTYWLN